MLLQTNSYVVPKDKRVEHARVLRRFRQALQRLGCDHFEVYEQVGANWNAADVTGRYVQIMRFRDRKHQLEVQAAERNDPTTQALLREFCELINFPYQQQQGLFAVGYYTSFLRMPPARTAPELGAMEPAVHPSHEHAPEHTASDPATESHEAEAAVTDEAPAGDSTDATADATVEPDHTVEHSADQAENSNAEPSESAGAPAEDSESHVTVLRQFELGPDDTDMPIPFSQGDEIGVEDLHDVRSHGDGPHDGDAEDEDLQDSGDSGSTSAFMAEDANGEKDDEATSQPDR
jgi:hypothetical protein